MSKDFFVMLTTEAGDYTPLVDENGDLEKFEHEIEARAVACETILGDMFGYEVFEIGRGC